MSNELNKALAKYKLLLTPQSAGILNPKITTTSNSFFKNFK